MGECSPALAAVNKYATELGFDKTDSFVLAAGTIKIHLLLSYWKKRRPSLYR